MAFPMQNQLPAYQGGHNRFMPQGLPQSAGYGFNSGQNQNQNQFSPIQNIPAPNSGSGNSFWDFLFGTPESYNQFNRFSPQGMQALSYLLSSGQNQLQNPTQGFEPIQQEALQNFYGSTVPGIAESFTAFGNNNNRGSSGLTGRLGAAGSGLQSLLAAQKAQYGQQQQSNALNQFQLGLQDPYQIIGRSATPGFINTAVQGFANNADKLAKLFI